MQPDLGRQIRLRRSGQAGVGQEDDGVAVASGRGDQRRIRHGPDGPFHVVPVGRHHVEHMDLRVRGKKGRNDLAADETADDDDKYPLKRIRLKRIRDRAFCVSYICCISNLADICTTSR